MLDFKAKMHKIRFRLRPRWGSLQPLHTCSSIYIIRSTCIRSFLPVCFPSSLESTPGFFPSTTWQYVASRLLLHALISPQFCIAQSFEQHFLHRFHRLTTLKHHPPPFHSFIPGFKKLSFFLPTVAFPFFLRTGSTDSPDCLPTLVSISVLYF